MKESFLVTIGLEIHAQLKSGSKLFSPDSASFRSSENDCIHPVSMALPGALPVLNQSVLKMALKTGKAFKSELKKTSLFARKNYFYPDLPKGYQISQYEKPFCEGGQVDFFDEEEPVSIPLERIHLEEDAGRSLHKGAYSLINFNRAGVPLLEIVTKPEIADPHTASLCAKAIRRLLRYLEVCDGNLEEGSMRCDCNVSIRPKGQKELGVKVELKNINSFRFIEKALDYEIRRQKACFKSGETIRQETRLYDPSKNQTKSMRSKESASDYRYFPDPDLPELVIPDEFLNSIKIPETAFDKTLRFIKDYQLPAQTAQALIEDKNLADYFEAVVGEVKKPTLVSLWFQGELRAYLKESSQKQSPIPVKDFARLLHLIATGEISNTMAKEIFATMWKEALSPDEIIEKKQLKQISGQKELEELVIQVLKKHPQQVKDYQAGRTKIFGFFVGQIMKETKGQANPQKLAEILKSKIKES